MKDDAMRALLGAITQMVCLMLGVLLGIVLGMICVAYAIMVAWATLGGW